MSVEDSIAAQVASAPSVSPGERAMNFEESADLEKEQQVGNAPVSIYSESLQEQKKTTTQWFLSGGMTNDVAMYVVVYKKNRLF